MMPSRYVAAALLAFATLRSPAMAQDDPVRPIRIVSPYPPGGTTDILGRARLQW